MRIALVFLISFILCGCSRLPMIKSDRQDSMELDTTLAETRGALISARQENKKLAALLQEREAKIKDLEAKLEKMRKQLATFGVFQ